MISEYVDGTYKLIVLIISEYWMELNNYFAQSNYKYVGGTYKLFYLE